MTIVVILMFFVFLFCIMRGISDDFLEALKNTGLFIVMAICFLGLLACIDYFIR